MNVHDLLDEHGLASAVGGGYVRFSDHPEFPLRIFNYTEQTQWERAWTDVTRTCRGLVINTETNEVVARPFPKFFNYGEHAEGELDLDARVVVRDKLDGSLGILYEIAPYEYSIATRGSFTSEQAFWATRHYVENYRGRWQPAPGYTYLFEIIYPENRIVCAYDTPGLYLLALVHNETGLILDPNGTTWPGPIVDTFEHATLREALEAKPRPNAEGLVVHFLDANTLVKIKQDDYVELHRIVTGLNERGVWEHLADGKPVEELLERVPDELHTWILDVATALATKHNAKMAALNSHWREINDTYFNLGLDLQDPREFRKWYAAQVAKCDPALRPLLFLRLDNQYARASRQAWQQLRPVNPAFVKRVTEDVA